MLVAATILSSAAQVPDAPVLSLAVLALRDGLGIILVQGSGGLTLLEVVPSPSGNTALRTSNESLHCFNGCVTCFATAEDAAFQAVIGGNPLSCLQSCEKLLLTDREHAGSDNGTVYVLSLAADATYAAKASLVHAATGGDLLAYLKGFDCKLLHHS